MFAWAALVEGGLLECEFQRGLSVPVAVVNRPG